MRTGALACTLLAMLASAAGQAVAQPLRGPGDDALTLSRRTVRVVLGTSITDASHRYGRGTAGRADGALEPLGIDFSSDTLGVAQFPGLASAQAALRTLTGNNAFTLNLGRTQLSSSVRTQVTPILLEAGITSRLQVSVMVPLVSARNEASLNINGGTPGGNVGVNPIRSGTAGVRDSASTTNGTLVSELNSAASQLSTLIGQCTADPAFNAQCPTILANGPTITAGTTAFLDAFTVLYGSLPNRGAVVVPSVGGAADSAIRNRISTFRSQYAALGVTALNAAGPTRAPAFTPATLLRVTSDSTLGLLVQPIRTITRQGIGDIEIGAKFRLFDAFGGSDTTRFLPRGLSLRQSVGAAFRAGTGTIDAPDHFLDVGTGDGQNDVEVRSFTDVLYGRRFFGSVVGRYTMQLPDQPVRRITGTPEDVWAPAYRQQVVDRNLGDVLEVEFTPRWVVSDNFAFAAQYLFRHKGEDRHTGTYLVPVTLSGLDAPLPLDASTLDAQTGGSEQRLGWGFTYSTMATRARGRTRLPIEVQYFNSRTVAGRGGLIQKISVHQFQLRFYPRS
ncbi:MAG: hypothetical protein IT355_10485 [Gemmatimonadaceae bacterium]|nr:hypothetical protein [Gemmatimonadaceae bacterium]